MESDFFYPGMQNDTEMPSFFSWVWVFGCFFFSFGADIWKSKHNSDELQVWTTDIYFIINDMIESGGGNPPPPLFFLFSLPMNQLPFLLKMALLLTSCIPYLLACLYQSLVQ